MSSQSRNPQPGSEAEMPEPSLQAIDLMLGEGEPAERAELQAQIEADPLAMLEMADTVALVERLREVRVEAGDSLLEKLEHVTRRATRRLPAARPQGSGGLWLMAAAALMACVGLHRLDPAGLHRPAEVEWISADRRAEPVVAVAAPTDEATAWESAVDRMRQRLLEQGSPQLRDAFEQGLGPDRDALRRWIDPRNALVWLQLDHELRANAARRWEAMAVHGGLPAADERAQQLACGLAAQLPGLMLESPSPHTVTAVSLAVRALVATGADPRRNEVIELAGQWLARQAEGSRGVVQVSALAGLADFAALQPAQRDVVQRIGSQLVDDVLRCDIETWEKRLPDLVGNHVGAAALGELGRVLAKLPAFGVDSARCGLVRHLCLGQLRSRSANAQPSAEVMAATVFGFADLLPEAERADCELQLLRWKPVRLLPDFVTVQQLAWGIEPGRRGFSRLQNELRQLAVCPTPAAFAERAVFCLCLAKDYAAFADHGALALGGS